MLEKKSAKGDLDARKITFVLIGIVFIFALVYVSFEMFATQPTGAVATTPDEIPFISIDDDVLSTDQTPPPPPPLPQQETIMNIVANTDQVITPEILSTGLEDLYGVISEPIPSHDVEIVAELVEPPSAVRFAAKQPEFPGGMEVFYATLRNELKYPEPAKVAGIQGYVVVEFIVETDGRLSNLNVINKLFPACDEEAVRALKLMPNWIPAEQMNKKVRCYFQIPIKFTLQ